MPKEIELDNWEEVNTFIQEFDKLYDIKTIILLGREGGVRRIDLH